MWKIGIIFFSSLLFRACDFSPTASVTVEGINIPLGNLSQLLNTRRILRGKYVGDTRPYMVYIRPAPHENSKIKHASWLCGGAIIHERFILTSAACIEQAQHFYVVSGTNKWTLANETNECIKYGAKKAIWKCVPKNYVFDGEEFDNIRWMIGDIAVVKVEEDFNFERRIRGCDFIPKPIAYNNQTAEYEKPGTVASTAGWGSQDAFSDDLHVTAAANSPDLLETETLLISHKNCKKRWPERYHYIIEEHMICGKDGMDSDTMSSVCTENEVNCKELAYSDDEDDENSARRSKKTRRMVPDPDKNDLQALRVGRTQAELLEIIKNDARRAKANKIKSGGFCENDHGGPLVVGHGMTSMVVGVISACQTHPINLKCFGPFLYTSVFRYRNLISCAINKEIAFTCRKVLRSSDQTSFDWSDHPDGPAKDVVHVTTWKNEESVKVKAIIPTTAAPIVETVTTLEVK